MKAALKSYQLVRSKRRKNVSIQVSVSGEVVVKVPSWLQHSVIEGFLLEKEPWIKAQLEKLTPLKSQLESYQDGGFVYFLDELIRIKKESGKRDACGFKNNILWVTQSPSSRKNIETIISSWYRKQAREIFERRFKLCNDLFAEELPVYEWKIRKMKRRWGSCSNTRVVTLNLYLVKCSLELIDYVILHELCHLFYLNHGVKFYRLLGQVCPQWELREQELRKKEMIFLG